MPTDDTQAATATDTTTTTPANQPPPEPHGQQGTDWAAEAKKWEARAKDNFAKAKQFDELQEAQKSEQQKLLDAKTAAERDAAAARTEALRYRLASKHGLSDEDAETFLTGSDEETLNKQAERLLALKAGQAGRPPSFDGGTRQPAPAADGDMNAFLSRAAHRS